MTKSIIALLLCAIAAQGAERTIESVELEKRGIGVGKENGFRIRGGRLSLIEDARGYIIRWRVDDLADDYREDYTDKWNPEGRHIGDPNLIYAALGGFRYEELDIVCDGTGRGVALSLHPSEVLALPRCWFSRSNIPEDADDDAGPTAKGIPLADGWIGVALWAEHPQYFKRNKYQSNCEVSCFNEYGKPSEYMDREERAIENESRILNAIRAAGLDDPGAARIEALPLWDAIDVDGRAHAPGAGITRRRATAAEWVFPPSDVVWRMDGRHYAEGEIENGVLRISLAAAGWEGVCEHWELLAGRPPREIRPYGGFCTQADRAAYATERARMAEREARAARLKRCEGVPYSGDLDRWHILDDARRKAICACYAEFPELARINPLDQGMCPLAEPAASPAAPAAQAGCRQD